MSPMPRIARSLFVWTVAIAAAGAWWMLRAASVETTERGEPVPIFAGADAVDVDAISTIRLARRDGGTYVFERRDGRWAQTEPFVVDLDDFSMRQFATGLAALARIRGVDDLAQAKTLGFEPPAATLTLESAGTDAPRQWTIDFGKRGVAGRVFVRHAQAVDVVDATLFERAVEMDPKEWRSRTLFPETFATPIRLRWVLADGTVEVVRQGERWQLVSPLKARADADRLSELLTAIGRARSDGFLQDQPKELGPFGLDRPAATLIVDARPESTTDAPPLSRSLLIGAPLGVGTSDRYAMIEGIPSVVRVSSGTQTLLFPRPESLIDPVASGTKPADIKRVEIRGKVGTIELVRSLDQWTAAIVLDGAAGAAVPANANKVNALLQLLCVTRATEMALGGFPKELEVATVLFFGFDGKPLDVVRIARDPKTEKWGLENGDGAMRIHPPTIVVPIGAADFGV